MRQGRAQAERHTAKLEPTLAAFRWLPNECTPSKPILRLLKKATNVSNER
jgi:hypothetical protein